MSGIIRQEQYLSLVESFLSGNLAAASFCAKFTALWIQGRDNAYAKKATWPQPYDELLMASWQRGEISDGEFQREFAKLWGYAEEVEFRNMIDEIHSACSVFRPSPELQGEINEEQFRQDVKKSLVRYQRLNEPVAQAV